MTTKAISRLTQSLSFSACNVDLDQKEFFKDVSRLTSGLHRIGQIDGHPTLGDIPYVASLMPSTAASRTDGTPISQKEVAEALVSQPAHFNVTYFKPIELSKKTIMGLGLAILQTAFPEVVEMAGQ